MSDYEEDVQVEIQKTLASINEVTIKIKKELLMIVDLIRDEGRLGAAVKDANEALYNVVQDLGIDITAGPPDAEGNDERADDLLVPLTPDLIDIALLAIGGESETQSQ